mmetsp:Transcript_40455/g.67199  ORF Transcript_40455/g.67199 Transcript_40455/m.67199 type:complete len:160 (-) Transcript_40455:126-605(-)
MGMGMGMGGMGMGAMALPGLFGAQMMANAQMMAGAPGMLGNQMYNPYAQYGYGAGMPAMNASRPSGPPRGREGAISPLPGDREQMLTQDQAGKLIGHRGAGVKELREKSGAVIRIGHHNVPGTEYRKMTLAGSEEALDLAEKLIQEKLAEEIEPSKKFY